MVEAGGLVLTFIAFLLELCCKSKWTKEGKKKQVFINFPTIADRTTKANYIMQENHHEVKVPQKSKCSTQESSDEQDKATLGQLKEAADIEIIYMN